MFCLHVVGSLPLCKCQTTNCSSYIFHTGSHVIHNFKMLVGVEVLFGGVLSF